MAVDVFSAHKSDSEVRLDPKRTGGPRHRHDQ